MIARHYTTAQKYPLIRQNRFVISISLGDADSQRTQYMSGCMRAILLRMRKKRVANLEAAK